jgi:hypothetical protein
MGVHDRGPIAGRLAQLWHWVTLPRVQRPIELTAAAVLAIWGVLLISPLRTFAQPAYAAFRVLGWSEEVWGLIFLVTALLISAGLVLEYPRWRIVGLINAAGLFAFIGVMFVLGNPAGMGWAGNFGYMMLCLHVLRRLTWK